MPVFGPVVPEEWQARRSLDGPDGETVTGPIAPVERDEDILRAIGYNPDEIEIVGNIMQWGKEQPDGSWRVSYRFSHRKRNANLDLPALYAAARRSQKPVNAVPGKPRTTIVALADMQIGKVASRGGTPELLQRLEEKRQALTKHLAKVKPTGTVLAECGDAFEGFNSGGNPMFTNDLSLGEQMDVAGTEIYEFVKLMSKHGHVDVLSTPSNHTQWRQAKQQLGRPGDDLGMMVHRQVGKIATASGLDVEWHFSPMFDEAVTLDVRGTTLGMVHGNQYGPGGGVTWWQRQQHGGQPIGAADVLLSGHYHHLSILPTGRNPYTGKSKWWLQAPTTDNGSDWFRNAAGDDSDPGLLVFDITEDGFDLQSLTVL